MRRRSHGFTLIELMIVVAIIPLVMGAISMLFLSHKSGHESLHGALRMEYGGAKIMSAIRRDLRAATAVDLERGELSARSGSREITYALKDGWLRRQERGPDGELESQELAAARCFEPRRAAPRLREGKLCLEYQRGEITRRRQVQAAVSLGGLR